MDHVLSRIPECHGYICIYAGVRACLCGHTCRCVCRCECPWDKRLTATVLLYYFSPSSYPTVSLTEPRAQYFWLDWWLSNFIPCPSSRGFAWLYLAFMWLLGIWTHIFMLVHKNLLHTESSILTVCLPSNDFLKHIPLPKVLVSSSYHLII